MDGYTIRQTTPRDLAVVLHHRRRMHPRDPQPTRAWVVNMFTEPEDRRRGLARRLMETILEWCRRAGMRTLYLHASDTGCPLYESLGFLATNEMRLAL